MEAGQHDPFRRLVPPQSPVVDQPQAEARRRRGKAEIYSELVFVDQLDTPIAAFNRNRPRVGHSFFLSLPPL